MSTSSIYGTINMCHDENNMTKFETREDGTFTFTCDKRTYTTHEFTPSLRAGTATTGTFKKAVATWTFDPATDQTLSFSGELPYTYAEGTSVVPYVRWSKDTDSSTNVQWTIDLMVSSGGTSGAFSSTMTDTSTPVDVPHTAETLATTRFKDLTMTSIASEHPVFVCGTITRNTHIDTPHPGGVWLHSIGLEYTINKCGTRVEDVK